MLLPLATQARVREAFQILRSGWKMFFVAYRLSTITNEDLIFFIKDSKIVQYGTYQKSIRREGDYFEL